MSLTRGPIGTQRNTATHPDVSTALSLARGVYRTPTTGTLRESYSRCIANIFSYIQSTRHDPPKSGLLGLKSPFMLTPRLIRHARAMPLRVSQSRPGFTAKASPISNHKPLNTSRLISTQSHFIPDTMADIYNFFAGVGPPLPPPP